MKQACLFSLLTAILMAPPVSSAQTMRERAEDLQLPTLRYRGETLNTILLDIRDLSREADPEGHGVNLILRLPPAEANRKLTLTVGKPTVKRALDLLAATADLRIRYDAAAIVVRKAENVVGGS